MASSRGAVIDRSRGGAAALLQSRGRMQMVVLPAADGRSLHAAGRRVAVAPAAAPPVPAPAGAILITDPVESLSPRGATGGTSMSGASGKAISPASEAAPASAGWDIPACTGSGGVAIAAPSNRSSSATICRSERSRSLYGAGAAAACTAPSAPAALGARGKKVPMVTPVKVAISTPISQSAPGAPRSAG